MSDTAPLDDDQVRVDPNSDTPTASTPPSASERASASTPPREPDPYDELTVLIGNARISLFDAERADAQVNAFVAKRDEALFDMCWSVSDWFSRLYDLGWTQEGDVSPVGAAMVLAFYRLCQERHATGRYPETLMVELIGLDSDGKQHLTPDRISVYAGAIAWFAHNSDTLGHDDKERAAWLLCPSWDREEAIAAAREAGGIELIADDFRRWALQHREPGDFGALSKSVAKKATKNAKAADKAAALKQAQTVAATKKKKTGMAAKKAAKKLFIITPPEEIKKFEDEFGPLTDVCPYPRPEGFDALAGSWDEMFPTATAFFCNPMFVNNDTGQGPTEFARKAIEEHKRTGKTVVFLISAQNGSVSNFMDEAGAKSRSMGRLKWLEATTGEPMPSPPPCTCYILRGEAVAASDLRSSVRSTAAQSLRGDPVMDTLRRVQEADPTEADPSERETTKDAEWERAELLDYADLRLAEATPLEWDGVNFILKTDEGVPFGVKMYADDADEVFVLIGRKKPGEAPKLYGPRDNEVLVRSVIQDLDKDFLARVLSETA